MSGRFACVGLEKPQGCVDSVLRYMAPLRALKMMVI